MCKRSNQVELVICSHITQLLRLSDSDSSNRDDLRKRWTGDVRERFNVGKGDGRVRDEVLKYTQCILDALDVDGVIGVICRKGRIYKTE